MQGTKYLIIGGLLGLVASTLVVAKMKEKQLQEFINETIKVPDGLSK